MLSRSGLQELRHQYPDRQIWVGDEADPSSTAEISASDVVVSLLTVGYETLGEHAIAPWSALRDVAHDVDIYSLSRTIKDPGDAAQVFLERTARPYVHEFLRQTFALIEDAHSQGFQTTQLSGAIDSVMPTLVGAGIRVNNQIGAAVGKHVFCRSIWQEILAQMAQSIEQPTGD